jgi:uncharacterized protein (DUF433 family)
MSTIHYISSHKDVLDGTPVITGTRIPVQRVAELVSQGYDEKTIKKEFGTSVTIRALRGVLYELAYLGLERYSELELNESGAAHA